MKTIIVSSLGILAALVIGMNITADAQSQQGNLSRAMSGAAPIGAICEVQVIASAYDASSGKFTFRGNLVTLGPEWVVLKEGNYQNWIPREKVVFIKASL